MKILLPALFEFILPFVPFRLTPCVISAPRLAKLAVTGRISSRQRIVSDICIKSEGLRITQLRIRHRLGFCTPVRTHHASHAASVVPGPEVFQPALTTPSFPVKL